jgi:peptidoglycan/LPS O-acetylase OafA/YrhL
MNYRADIDGLRAVAVIPVVFYHAGLVGFSGGYVGVDVFFVISGYLITGIIWREIREGRFSLLGFYERRARRILPALFAVILFSAVVSYQLLTPEELSNFAVSVLGSIFFVQNFVLEAQAGYFDASSATKPLLHVWSLAVEEQFYILFPLALLIAVRVLDRRGVIVLLVLTTVLSFVLASYLVFRSPVFTFYMLPLRAWELLAGSLLAIASTVGASGRDRLRDAVSITGLAAILLPVFLYSSQTPFPGYTAAVPVFGATALIWAGPYSLVGRALSWRPLVFVGLISYSLYLWHWPLIAFHKLIFPDDTPLAHGLGLITASLVLAVLSWRFVEIPSRQPNGPLSTRWRFFAASGTVAAGFLTAALLTIGGNGWPWRAAPEIIALANVAQEKLISDAQCRPEEVLFNLRGRERGFCRLGDDEIDVPDVLVWGDSHVGAWFPMLDSAFTNAGTSGYAISMAGCPIAFDLDRADYDNEGCSEASRAIQRYMQENNIRKVVIVGSWFGVLDNKDTVYAGQRSINDATRLENVTRAIADTGDWLVEMGISSAFLVTVPGARHSVPESLFREAQLGFYPETRRSEAEYGALMGPIRRVAEAHFDTVIRTDRLLCDSGQCDILRDGRPLYYDSNHPSLFMNEVMLPHLQSEFTAFLEQ